jgi:hypothetical protein
LRTSADGAALLHETLERRPADQSRALTLTLESLHEGVFTTGQDGRAVVWNRRLLELRERYASAANASAAWPTPPRR